MRGLKDESKTKTRNLFGLQEIDVFHSHQLVGPGLDEKQWIGQRVGIR